MKSIGLVCDKFAPLHKGHIALIEYAINRCDNLIVFVCNSTIEQERIKIDLDVRIN
jgi:cytidyltransferase-like protein